MIPLFDLLSNLHITPPSSMPRDVSFPNNLSSLENAFSKKELNEIIENRELFWFAFCKAFSQIKGKASDTFATSLNGHSLTISGREHIIRGIQEMVEEMRAFFVKGLAQKTGFTLVPVKGCDDIFLREKADVIDLSDWLSDRQVKLYKCWFNDFIRPTMKGLCESLGANFSEVSIIQDVIVISHESQTIKAFQIDWKSKEHFVYPIPSLVIPPREDSQKSMLSLYEKQILCDLTLIAKDGELKVHSPILFVYGGEAIQTMLTCNMKEAAEKTIRFENFSINTVKAFTDFIYLGEASLEPETFLQKEIDWYELFELANLYQVQPLINCCTNLFTLLTCPKDLEQIKRLAEFYNNRHLMDYYRYLLSQAGPSQTELIKV